MRRRLAVIGFAAVLTVTVSTPALATETVDDDRAQCPAAQHETIQAGVDAAAHDERVLVCDGTYREAVLIAGEAKDGVRLVAKARRHAIIEAPVGNGGSIVQIDGADRVQVRRFVVTGPFRSAHDGCPPPGLRVGVEIVSEAVGALVSDNLIQLISAPVGGSCDRGGTGVEVVAFSQATIVDNRIEAESGVGVFFGSGARIDRNAILGGDRPLQSGVVIATTQAPTAVVANRILRTGNGIYVQGGPKRLQLIGNRVFDNNGFGVAMLLQQGGVVRANDVSGNSRDGINLDAVQGVRLERNDFRGNGGLDCFDGSGGAFPAEPGFPTYTTVNTWINNRGLDADPGPICTPSGAAGPPVGP